MYKYKYNRNFRLLGAKLLAFFIGTLAWLLAFVHLKYDGFHTLFQVADGLKYISKDAETMLLTMVFTYLILYGGLLVGLSFLRGKARSVTSIVFASILIICSSVVGLAISYIDSKVSFYTSDLITNGFGLYVFIACCVGIIVISAVDLVMMSNEKKMDEERRRNSDDIVTIDAHTGTLTCVGGEYVNFSFPIKNGETLAIGKDPKSCSVVITQDNQYVSGIHCLVRYIDGKYEILDRSKNGVKIGGSQITPQVWVYVQRGTIFSLANSNNNFRID